MTTRHQVKLIHEGMYLAEVDIKLLETDDDWAPYLSLEDVYKLDDVREALRRDDIQSAAKYARIFKLQPVAI